MPGRSIEIAGEVDPADLWTAHRAHLARLADSTAPITVEGYCAMRNVAHEALCRTVNRMNRLAIALMVAACVLSFAVGVAVGVRSGTGWVAAVTGLVCLVLLVPLSTRLSWVLRHVRRLRAPYPLGTQA